MREKYTKTEKYRRKTVKRKITREVGL